MPIDAEPSQTEAEAFEPDPEASGSVQEGSRSPLESDAQTVITNEDYLTLFTTAQVAGMFQVTSVTIRKMMDRGELGFVKVGRQYRIRRADLIRFASDKYPETDQITVYPEGD